MVTYLRMIDWSTEFRSGRTVYVVRHAIRTPRGNKLLKTWHFDNRPNRTQAEAAGQARVNELNTQAQLEQNRQRLDLNHFEHIKEQLKELIDLGVTSNQISNRLDNMIANLKAEVGQ
jgi:hypothetical protein